MTHWLALEKEEWNDGMMKDNLFLKTHYSNIPVFPYFYV
jgi:hypothetical protein